MKIINILCLVFFYSFLVKGAVAQENEYFVSPHLYEFGTERVNDRLLRWAYYGFSTDSPCLKFELLDVVLKGDEDKSDQIYSTEYEVYVIEDELEICELYVKDEVFDEIMHFSKDLSGSELHDIKVGEAEVTFTAVLHMLGPNIRILECKVPIKDQKIHKEECVIVSDKVSDIDAIRER